MFLISQLAESVLIPSNVIGAATAVALISLLLGWKQLGRTLLVLAALLLLVAGWSPIGPAALMILEDRFTAPELDGPVTGVILLGGAVDTHITAERSAETLNEAGERVTAAAMLARSFPQARILLSGGAGHALTSESVTESAIARDLLAAMGVDPSRIEMEEHSRDTCENAEQSRLLAKPQPGEEWLLVTSASHMPRAVACFRSFGFAVTPYPVDYRTLGKGDFLRPAASIANGLQALDLAAHEWIGLVGYRLTRRTTELLPQP